MGEFHDKLTFFQCRSTEKTQPKPPWRHQNTNMVGVLHSNTTHGMCMGEMKLWLGAMIRFGGHAVSHQHHPQLAYPWLLLTQIQWKSLWRIVSVRRVMIPAAFTTFKYSPLVAIATIKQCHIARNDSNCPQPLDKVYTLALLSNGVM